MIRVILGIACLVAPLAAPAQGLGRVPRIGLLFTGSPGSPQRAVEAFHRGLRELGYVEGRNIVLEYRWVPEAKPEAAPDLAAELVRLNVDLIVAQALIHTAAAQRATSTIPIVTVTSGDPAIGFVASLARPGGNITGLSLMTPAMVRKVLELFKEAVPTASRVAALRHAETGSTWREAEGAARALGIDLRPVDVRGPEELERAFETMIGARVQGVVTIPSHLFGLHRARIAALALRHRLPSASFETGFADAGGLIAYGPDVPENFRRAATYVDKILRGAKPAELPIEQPTTFRMVVNLKTAKALGLTIPPSVLSRADAIIE